MIDLATAKRHAAAVLRADEAVQRPTIAG